MSMFPKYAKIDLIITLKIFKRCVIAYKKSNYFYAFPTKIPVVHNNCLHYNFHVMIQHLPKIIDSCDFDCLGKNTVNYVTLFVFLDK